MRDYSQSKIYKIVCQKTGLIYIGSTTEQRLCKRLAKHVSDFKCKYNISSKKIIENGDYYIELIELCNFSCKEELLKRERFYIENNDCVNKNIPLRSKKEYYEDNKEVITDRKSVV